MKLSYAHTGIPVDHRIEGMHFVEPLKLWISDVSDSPDGIEYLYFEEDSPAPEVMKTHRHIALATDEFGTAAAWCDEVVLGPIENTPEEDVMFALKDDALFEFCYRKG